MTRLIDLINPPAVNMSADQQYQNANSTFESLQGMVDFAMPSVLLNPDFNFLSGKGTTPTTQADGDNVEFVSKWFVFGASNATYTITPASYANNATQRTGSVYYVHLEVATYNGGAFYFYQRQAVTVRKYQDRPMMQSLFVNNNQDTVIGVRFDIYTYLDTADALQSAGTLYLQPGLNDLSSLIETVSLQDLTVGAANCTEFRLNFSDLNAGTADLDIYWIKSEFGKMATPLNIDHYAEEARLAYA